MSTLREIWLLLLNSAICVILSLFVSIKLCPEVGNDEFIVMGSFDAKAVARAILKV